MKKFPKLCLACRKPCKQTMTGVYVTWCPQYLKKEVATRDKNSSRRKQENAQEGASTPAGKAPDGARAEEEEDNGGKP